MEGLSGGPQAPRAALCPLRGYTEAAGLTTVMGWDHPRVTRWEAVQELSPWPEPSRRHGLHSFLGSRGSSPHSSSLVEGALGTSGGLGKLGFILPAPLPGPYKHSFPDHTLAQNSQPISHPSAAAPRNSSPPLTPSHTFLSWDSSSPSVCPLSPLPSSPALVALPVSCCPPALHLCLSELQVLISSHLA